MTRHALPALLAAVALALTGCGNQPEADQEAQAATVDSRLTDTYNACRNDMETRNRQISIADEGRTLMVDTNPDNSSYGDTPGGLICVLAELRAPQSVISKLERTTAMMGVQEENHDGLDYSWTYHPDNGTELIVTTGG